MAITITALNNEAAVAKTFTEIGKDMVSSAWYNSTDETSTFHQTLTIKQRITGKNGNGIAMRQTLIQCKATTPVDSIGSDPLVAPEDVFVNVTINTPVALQGLSATNRKDLVAFLRNFLTAANVDALVTGQV